MEPVNGAHIHQLLWAVLQRGRAEGLELAGRAGLTGPLSASHLRLLEHVPAEGARVTDLAARTRITKQALGQLATQLADRGYLETVPDPSDRRAKLLRRTPLGERACDDLHVVAAALEDAWRDRVGADRYAVFREVLAEIGEV
jgi:DNA-binding MarR family transcriptional regulator